MKTMLRFGLFLVLMTAAAASSGFPFWLESATRTNPHDPKSSNFRPVLPPVNTPTISPTFSVSPTPSMTLTPTPFAGSPTPSPTSSATPPPSLCPIPWVTVGSAIVAGQGVTLTPELSDLAGAAWSSSCISLLQDFTLRFKVHFGTPGGADGMVFALQTQGLNALGLKGGDKGYVNSNNNPLGVIPSVAFAISTYGSTQLDMRENAAGYGNACGSTTGLGCSYTFPVSLMDDAEHDYVVSWNAATYSLSLTIDSVLLMTYTKDVVADPTIFNGVSCVYYGFTAGTGGASALQYVYCY